MQRIFLAAVVGLTLLVGANMSAISSGVSDHMTQARIAGLIRKELRVGISRQEIERFFLRHKMPYSYDKYAARYQSLIGISQFHSVLVLIHLNHNQRFAKADVQDIYTAP